MTGSDQTDVASLVEKSFASRQIFPTSVSVRRFPGETIVVVEVKPIDFAAALELASAIYWRVMRER
jgi:hypothetical protein